MNIKNIKLNPGLFDYNLIVSGEGKEKTTEIELTLKGNTQRVGRHNHRMVIETDCEKMPSADVWMSDEVLGNIEVKPPSLYFHNFKPGRKETHYIDIQLTGKLERLDITGYRSQQKLVDLNMMVVQDGNSYRLGVTPNAKARGRLNDVVDINTNDPSQPIISVRIYGREEGYSPRKVKHFQDNKPKLEREKKK